VTTETAAICTICCVDADSKFLSIPGFRFRVRIGVRFGVRFGTKGGLQLNSRSFFSEMCLQTVVMGV
jgi:hypothetical protein